MSSRYHILIVLMAFLFAVPGFSQDQQQVNVTIKIIEFQTSKGMETGLSAYFARRMNPQPYGQVATGKGVITAASMAFQSSSTAGITLFLDELSNYYGEFELVLQALVDQNRAFILSQPKVMVPVGAAVPTTIATTQKIPYEKTVAVGATTVQTTDFRDTGVMVNVSALQLYDADGNPATTEDVYVQLKLVATVNEEGQRITVALDDNTSSSGGVFTRTSNAISVPEFISRSIDTTVWVRNGQALILGGLYRNTKQKNLASLPWLTQGENMINNLVNQISPFNEPPGIPLASPFGNRSETESRRELVFVVKADIWRKAFTVTEGFFAMEEEVQEGEAEDDAEIIKPKDSPNVIGDFIDSLTNAEEGMGVGGSLGGRDQ
jgi:Flp pilus assembly secretin CpaC